MLILGFDGGGSHARLAIAEQSGEIVFQGLAGGVNPMDNDNWRTNFEAVFQKAGDILKDVRRAVLGLPGWGEVSNLDAQVSDWLNQHLKCDLCLLNDVELAQRAAFDDGPGILLLSGTGSMAVSRTADGKLIRVGGFGDLIGDEGSAYDIGRTALAYLAQESDGRRAETVFGRRLKERLKLFGDNGTQALMAWLYTQTHSRSSIAAVAVIIDQLAEDGDGLAKDILRQAAQALACHYTALSRRLKQNDLPWSHAGSTFKSATFRTTIEHLIAHPPVAAKRDALAGALRIARQKNHIEVQKRNYPR